MKNFFLLIVILPVLLYSCKKQPDTVYDELEMTPLAREINKRMLDSVWVHELEGQRLVKKIDAMSGIASEISLTPAAMIAFGSSSQSVKPVYPFMEGFTTIDTTVLENECLEVIDLFFTSLKKDVGAVPIADVEKFYVKDMLHTYSLFRYDISSAGVIQSYLIGQAVYSGNIFEVPVRFTTSSKILYTILYLVNGDLQWRIQQVELYKTEAR